MAVAGCGKRNVVEGTVRDEKNAPVACRVVICKHEAGQICNHTHEGMPCKLAPTDSTAEVKDGVFRLNNVSPIDRSNLGYAVVVITDKDRIGTTPFFIWPKDPRPAHKGFNLPFGNKGAVVNIVVKAPTAPIEERAAAPEQATAEPESKEPPAPSENRKPAE
jgi:hypothetical protein